MTTPLYRVIAKSVAARLESLWNFQSTGRDDGEFNRHSNSLDVIINSSPCAGTDFTIDIRYDLSHADKLVFEVAYNHADHKETHSDWTEHIVTVRPALIDGIHIRVAGVNRNGCRQPIERCFDTWMRSEVSE